MKKAAFLDEGLFLWFCERGSGMVRVHIRELTCRETKAL